uniref:Uncharacterized protein n=1 Tax=Anopheles atroparvus TaxID=41427 RepID=A0AAG5D431_ANOAO
MCTTNQRQRRYGTEVRQLFQKTSHITILFYHMQRDGNGYSYAEKEQKTDHRSTEHTFLFRNNW